MRVAGIRQTGAPVEPIDLSDPRALADDEVLIEVRAAGVANWDEIVRAGNWDVGRRPPTALGVEAAGVIIEVGNGVTDWKPGDEVMTHPVPLREHGTWAPRLLAPAALLAPKPIGVSWEAAAAFPVPALTAEQVLRETLEVKDGEWLLIHGAGGVTGGVLVSLANHYGAQVIATASPSKHDRLQDLGAEHVLDYHDRRWPRQVLSLTEEKGVPAAVNAVPGGCSTAIQVVRDGGRLSTITSDPPEEERGIRVETVYVRADGAQLTSLARLLVAGRLPISVAARFPLDQAAEALDIARAGGVGGAIVLAITLVDEP